MNILLVDANNLAYRSYYAQNLKTTSGQNTGMVYGFINSMMAALREIPADVIVYVWDPPEGSLYRKNIYGLYKGQRVAMPAEFHDEKQLLQQLLDALGCAQITKPGVETDDVIGYLATQHYKDHNVTIYSNDKDLLQLIDDRVSIYVADKGTTQLNFEGKIPIKEQGKIIWIKPSQVPDYKALVGDNSDNYPGIPGFGIGAAITYFDKNESAQALINGTANLAGLRSNVIDSILNNRGMISTWLQLATLNYSEGATPVSGRSIKVPPLVNALFDQLEFKQFKALGDAIYAIGGR